MRQLTVSESLPSRFRVIKDPIFHLYIRIGLTNEGWREDTQLYRGLGSVHRPGTLTKGRRGSLGDPMSGPHPSSRGQWGLERTVGIGVPPDSLLQQGPNNRQGWMWLQSVSPQTFDNFTPEKVEHGSPKDGPRGWGKGRPKTIKRGGTGAPLSTGTHLFWGGDSSGHYGLVSEKGSSVLNLHSLPL